MAHGEHAESSQLLRGVEHNRRETTRHLGVEANLDTCLDLVLTLHQQVQELLGVHDSLPKVRHKANKSSVPLIHNLKIVGEKEITGEPWGLLDPVQVFFLVLEEDLDSVSLRKYT